MLLSVNKEMSSAVVDFKQFPIFLIQASMAEQQLEGGQAIERYCGEETVISQDHHQGWREETNIYNHILHPVSQGAGKQ